MANYDIALDGTGYMLIPGTYKSYPDGNLYVDSRLGRQVLTDFTAGMAGPKINARTVPGSAFYGESSRGAWPAPWPAGVNAVGPAPGRMAPGHSTDAATPKRVVRSGGYCFIASGKELWRWDNASAFTLRYTAANPILSMTVLHGDLFLAYGAAADTARYNDTTNAITGTLYNSKATTVASIGRRLFMAYAADPTQVTLWTENLSGSGTMRAVDSPVRATTIYEDSILIATDRSIYAIKPDSATTNVFDHWGVVSADGLQNADDFAWLTVFQGRLMAWQGGRAVLYDKQRGWWRHAGMEGAASYGAALVNGWLIASILPRGGATAQLWGYNGSGWWLLDEGYGRYPHAARGDRLVVWGEDLEAIHYFDMDSGRDASTLTDEFSVETALLDAGSPDQAKFWTQIGLELARADPASTGTWSVQLYYSLDAGATWRAAGPLQTVATPSATLTAPVGASGTYLRIRAVFTRNAGLPPFILAAWAGYEVLNESVRRRRWQFRVAATDRVVDRTGAPDGRSGATIRAALWDLFETSDTFGFTDVDGTARDVRMIGLREEWQRPADIPKVGAHTTLEIVLVAL